VSHLLRYLHAPPTLDATPPHRARPSRDRPHRVADERQGASEARGHAKLLPISHLPDHERSVLRTDRHLHLLAHLDAS